jgi:hypothetical protein
LGSSAQAQTVIRLAWVWSLAPDAVKDDSAPLLLAEAVADPRNYPGLRSHGAALYRAGKWDAATKQLEAARRLRPEGSPSVWLFLAMARHKAGDKTAAEWLDKAKKWVEDARKSEGGKPSRWESIPWHERAALEVLLKEAEGLIRPQ